MAIRLPIREAESTYTVTSFYLQPGIEPNPTSEAVVVSTMKEFIDSDDDASRRNQAKYCLHWKYRHSVIPHTVGVEWYGVPWAIIRNRVEQYADDPFLHVNAVANATMTDYPSDWDKVAEKVTGKLKNDYSLLNFLLELDDVKSLFKRWNGVSDFWLRYSFGAAPLLEDAKAVAKQLHTQFNKINNLSERLRRGFRAGTASKPKKFTYVIDTGSNGELELVISGTIKLRWTCFVQGFFHSNLVTRFLDVIGFYPTWSTAWNAVPFSFIIDYFIPIGNSLESQESSWSEMSAGLSMACRSVKIDFSTEVRLKSTAIYYGNYKSVYETPILAKGSGSLYLRIPEPFAVLDGVDFKTGLFSPISARQDANLHALTYEGLKKRKRPPSFSKWIGPAQYNLRKGFRFFF